MDKPIIGGFNDFSSMILQKYERYLPTAFDESMTLLQKVNKVIQYLNQIGDVTNDVVDQWNSVMTWVTSDGINDSVNAKLNTMVGDGSLESLINQTLFNDLDTRLTTAETNITTNATNITANATSITGINTSITGINTRLTNDEASLQGRYINIKYPPAPLVAAKVDGVTDDSDAINAIAQYLYTNHSGGTMLFPDGVTSIAKTIYLPDGVCIQGASTPMSQISPQATFNGAYAIESQNLDANTHHQIRDLFINFGNNSNVAGIWLHRPYDYTAISNVIGNRCCKQFIKIGDVNNTGVAQTVKIDSCIAYAWTGRTQPLLSVEFAQECMFINNKFLGDDGSTIPVALFDSCSQMTMIGNSFAFSDSVGALTLKATRSNYRLSGNHITNNLFEGCNGTYSIQIIGIPGSAGEGDSNSIINNRYENSTNKIYLDGVVGTQVFDYVSDVVTGSGARKSFIMTPYHVSSVQANGHLFLTADGNDLRIPVDGAGIILDSPDGSKHVRISVDNTGALVTATVS
jgi:hypothetical protein